jgi:FtsZ-interacting cell division protein ZipA
MSTGSYVLIIVGALSIISGLVLLMWRLHVRKQVSKGNDNMNATPMRQAEMRDFEEYGHLDHREQSLKDLERSLGLEREKPGQAMLGK